MSALYGQRVKTPLTAHLKIYPVARTLAERREVLRVTERFGEVTMFKSFKVTLPTFPAAPPSEA